MHARSPVINRGVVVRACSLRIPLTHESPEVRAATLRALRKSVSEEEHVQTINRLNIQFLIAR